MADIQVNHRDSRQVCPEDTRIRLAHFNQTQFHNGCLRDFSPNGVNFTRPKRLGKDAIVVLRFDRSRSGKPHATGQRIPRALTLDQIRWYRPALSTGQRRFEISASFLRPQECK